MRISPGYTVYDEIDLRVFVDDEDIYIAAWSSDNDIHQITINRADGEMWDEVYNNQDLEEDEATECWARLFPDLRAFLMEEAL